MKIKKKILAAFKPPFLVKFYLESDRLNIKRALISVWDKTGVVDFARELSKKGVSIVATHGTFVFLKENGINVTQVEQLTGYHELLDGRVKTLHPKIFAAVLAKLSSQEHLQQLYELGVQPIDMVVVNLRPLVQTFDEKALLESVDIGGLALLRAAAKNYRDVVPICDQSDYEPVLKSIDQCGDVVLQQRRKLCAKAFLLCSEYDRAVYRAMCELFAIENDL